ncbi:Stp1/IreP family PP2C-type Ser/Thr phosphatase [Calorimonas adulescens]|uniref:Stp1/IreP family PP2C-type Ser/Thr phosphatase n=1 Tax=Calorimonas adulescens TaxID=2606906 RepID=A0A5D8QJE8_9THEO|nr:Stp1/IreP family PP2C-type Ser/Thr phosphatase [Calorimonas adulescens]TZE83408.1 Stp1/IreP family PP2C-type Ser/Thr phosphatase [Calorimonas adulescens]
MMSNAVSNIGMVRDKNEDSFYVSGCDDPYKLYIVADGMGGHNAGEIASSLAVDAAKQFFDKYYVSLQKTDDMIEKFIREAIANSNTRVLNESQLHIDESGMGTTMTLLLIENNKFYIGHIGDSRAYLIRNNTIEQITEDHSLVTQMVKEGKLSIAEAKYHPLKNIITRAIGVDMDINIDVYIRQAVQGDIVILCTDGLSNMVTDAEILEEYTKCDIVTASNNLVECSNARGGYDNITIVAVKC